jgi:TRAP transporter TAXI family solute receptor
MKHWFRIINGTIILIALSACSENLSSSRPYILTTATTGGTYYPVGVAIATITKSQLYETKGISLSAISSAGSLENIKLLRDNQAQFAMLQGIFAAWAWHGDGPIGRPQPWLRSIGALWAPGIRVPKRVETISCAISASTMKANSTLPTWAMAQRPMRFRTAPSSA